jgi:hypothetical protein
MWKKGQSGNPQGRWKRGQSGNPNQPRGPGSQGGPGSRGGKTVWQPIILKEGALIVLISRSRRECRIGERPHRNGNRIGPPLRLPKNCRATIRAKVKVNREPGIGASSISSKVSIRLNVLAREKCGYAVCATCSPLALQTMADRNLDRIASTRYAELPTRAGRGSRGHDPSPPNLVCRAQRPSLQGSSGVP